jgi:hypothetical protein
MAINEDDLLSRELGKVGASGGKFGGKLSGETLAGLAGGVGGSLGARFSASFLPTERHQIQINLRSDARVLLAKAYSFFCSNGRVLSDAEGGSSPYPKVSGVVGSGFLNMNPAVVHMEIISISSITCTVSLTGAAKEGLIKQKTAEKAVKRLADFFESEV